MNDLFLYITNTGDIYFKTIIPLCENLAKKKAAGKFSKPLAVKAFVGVVKTSIPRYKKEIGYLSPLSQKSKEQIAECLLDYYEDIIDEIAKKAKKATKKTAKKTTKKK